MKELTKGRRITGAELTTLTSELVSRYEAGESIRALAADLGRSYGFVQGALKNAGVVFRSRGGAHPPKNSKKKQPLSDEPALPPTDDAAHNSGRAGSSGGEKTGGKDKKPDKKSETSTKKGDSSGKGGKSSKRKKSDQGKKSDRKDNKTAKKKKKK